MSEEKKVTIISSTDAYQSYAKAAAQYAHECCFARRYGVLETDEHVLAFFDNNPPQGGGPRIMEKLAARLTENSVEFSWIGYPEDTRYTLALVCPSSEFDEDKMDCDPEELFEGIAREWFVDVVTTAPTGKETTAHAAAPQAPTGIPDATIPATVVSVGATPPTTATDKSLVLNLRSARDRLEAAAGFEIPDEDVAEASRLIRACEDALATIGGKLTGVTVISRS